MSSAAATNDYPYIIVLKNESARYVNIVGFILCVGSAILFAREMIYRHMIIAPYLAGIIFIAGLLLWNAFLYFKSDKEIYYSKALLIAGIVWTRMPYFPWLVMLFAFLALMEYQAKKPQEIGFADDHIMFNRLFRKKISWSAVDNVVLKHGVLTVDFKNNKLLQREIDTGDNEATEEEFNRWAQSRLSKL